ncbi:2-polyprenyl-6-methoxyphenol hydroxylase-like FAD-dependent oxidoreductase [Paenibacillus sp. V4I9]|uniref:NAD(P)/FAD-dependent oxidoreductase n=1 Tax=Paenibacillus sp. V4I9 TaxID=3042308 RepID=UPI00278A8C86|nr:FAD dependent oxidoreductase [Paenibacillus sp. V4I9]MDQ0888545.1 2-polyprenyl-6-methoxyphenol hydroxylase-like FAD-dependent oxidoreductase [Paenibacillus sp. V4I9]
MSNMNKAVVIGAGIAGLITARMLSEYYKEVYIVERDELPTAPANRQGTPQSFHPHRVLPRGHMILERYFPGYTNDLLDHGAHPSDAEEMVLVNQFGTLVNRPLINSASSSRALLEWVLRRRVQNIHNVHFLTNTEVIGLMSSEDRQTITGIYTKKRNENKQEGMLTADMVIDTAGRSSKVIKWLNSLGHTVPDPEVLKVSLGYSTQYYKIPPQADKEWRSVISEAQPAKGISTGMLLRIEDNIAGTLLFSAGGEHYPPTKPDEFQEELKNLNASEIAKIVSNLEPLQGPRGYRTPESIRQHFEKMENWPSGLLVLGDAFCNFDPIYGQGMTVAAIEAETIANCLEEQRRNSQPYFERHVLHRMQEAIDPAWWLSSIADLRWKGVEHIDATPIKGVSFAQKYIDLFTKKAMELGTNGNSKFYLTQFLMNSLVLPPSKFFNAEILTMILNDNGSPEEKQLRAELGVQDPKLFQQRIDELIPSFDAAFDERLKDVLMSFEQQ